MKRKVHFSTKIEANQYARKMRRRLHAKLKADNCLIKVTDTIERSSHPWTVSLVCRYKATTGTEAADAFAAFVRKSPTK